MTRYMTIFFDSHQLADVVDAFFHSFVEGSVSASITCLSSSVKTIAATVQYRSRAPARFPDPPQRLDRCGVKTRWTRH
jgi:hypothetical protein